MMTRYLQGFVGFVLLFSGSMSGLWGLFADNYRAHAERQKVLIEELSSIEQGLAAVSQNTRWSIGRTTIIDTEPRVSWGFLLAGAALIGVGGHIILLPLHIPRGGPNERLPPVGGAER